MIDVSVFALEYQIACTGTPSVKIEIQQSSDNANWYNPDNMAVLVANVITKTLHGLQLGLIPVRYLRFKITELTTTVSDTVITLKISAQKRFKA